MKVAPLGSEGDPEEGPVKAFWYYVQTGDIGPTKALQEGSDCEGGYLVPQGFNADIIAKLAELSWPRLAGVTMFRTNRDVFRIPIEGTEPALPTVTAEEGSYTTDSPTFEVLDATIYKFTKLIKASEELLADDATSLETWMTRRVAEAYAEAEGKYVAVGTGSSQPQGVFVGGTAGLTLDSAADISAAEIPELLYKLQSQYRGRSSTAWLAHPDTEAFIRMIRDANHFAFPGGSGEGGSIARGGRMLDALYSIPFFTDDDCATMGTTAKSLIVGDFSFYAMVENGGFSLLRLNELYSETGQIGFRWNKRWGGGVMQAEAFQYATQA